MRNTWFAMAVLMMAMVLALGAGAAWAGQYTSPKDKAKVADINKRLAAEKAAIAKKYEQEAQKRQVAKVTVPKPVVSEDRGLPSPVKTAFLTPFVTVGTGLMALGEGWQYVTASKFESPASQACRAGNTAKSQLLYHPYNVIKEFLTGFTGNTQFYDPSKLNCLGERAKKRGPGAQMAEMAATVIPPTMVATGVTAPFLGLTFPEMAVTTGAIGAVGGIGVGEAFDYAEKSLIK